MFNDLSIIILSAGKGSRMKTSLPKVMHQIAGRSMLDRVIDQAIKLNPRDISLVISRDIEKYQTQIINNHPFSNFNFIIQEQRLGTAHAVSCALDFYQKSSQKLSSKILILYGDTPLISSDTLVKMLHQINDHQICILAFENEQTNSYGKLVIDDNGQLKSIIENKDATKQQQAIKLCNSGVMAIKSQSLIELIDHIKNDNLAKEFYLTDLIKIAHHHHHKTTYIETTNQEVLGVNSLAELSIIEEITQNQLREKFMANGVKLIAPSSVFFNYDTEIENDVVIHPNVIFAQGVSIDCEVEIKSFCHLEGVKIKSGSVIGPFARIRKNTVINNKVKIGNFVEIKNSVIEDHAKINHLSYVGDSEVGSHANIGAGVITCNYDGYNKFKTVIGDDVFIGSNTALIAPVEIGKSAVIGAGSVITKNVASDELSIARSKQQNIVDGGKKFHQQKSRNKKHD